MRSRRAAAKALKATARIALTGTPVENHLGDLWSIFDFINPGLLGSAKQFSRYARMLADRETNPYGPLRELVRPYILRRMKTDKSIISDLPDKTEVKAWCGLSRRQAALYEQAVRELGDALENSDGIQRKGIVLAMLLRLKQICNHPSQWLRDGAWAEADSGKLARLREIAEVVASRQEKMLVFTQFREMTAPLAAFLAEVFGRPGLVLHGETAVRGRRDLVRTFQEDENVPFFVLSLKAGGSGLTLTAASHVVHFDRWWNPAVENQATDRAFRIGQKRNVLVHKFVCRGTVEEKIDALIESKQGVSDELLSGGGEINLTEMKDDDSAASGGARFERRDEGLTSMSWYGGWAPYVTVAERRRRAVLAMAKLTKKGHPVAPVVIDGRAIATTFWGKAWCENLESYQDFANRLPRGRTYVRNGSVLDLQIAPREVTAMVSGSSLYRISVSIDTVAKPHWRSICKDCAGGINSLVELLQGRLSQGVMERICRQGLGLFPGPKEIRFKCSCPDYAFMCKHVAAVLYGIGARLDQQPELLFRLRAVDEKDLLVGIDNSLPMTKAGPAAGKVLEADDLSAMFGLDMAVTEPSPATRAKPKRCAPASRWRARRPRRRSQRGVARRSKGGLAERRLAPFQAFRRPYLARAVVGLECRHAGGQRDPGQLRPRVDVHIRRQRRRIVERTDADEAQLCQAAVLAPDRRAAIGTAKDPMRPATVGRHRAGDRIAGQQLDPIGLDQRVEHERGAGLALAILAVAAMHEHRFRVHAVAQPAAGATSVQRVGHGSSASLWVPSRHRFVKGRRPIPL